MHPMYLLEKLKQDMTGYVSSKYPFFERGHHNLNKQLCTILDREGTLFQDPVIQLVRGRKSEVFSKSFFDQSIHRVLPDTPYSHQIKAWKNIKNDIPTVVATGTGSGKSECFMFPLIDGLLKKKATQGPRRVCAILLYPMNALVEDQYIRLQRYTTGTGLRVGIYNGAFKNLGSQQVKDITGRIVGDKKKLGLSEAEALNEIGSLTVDPQIPDTIPHILLTNYKMLEYMLLRPEDHPIFQDADIQYLVLDEAHTYTGTLGLELSCLLARLRVHLGEGGDHYLPIATSATLMQQSPGSDEPESDVNPKQMMRDFFTQLFGKEFSSEHWLIEDEFVPPPQFDADAVRAFISADLDAVRRALSRHTFSDCLRDLAGLYTQVRLDPIKEGQNFRSIQDQWARQLVGPLLTVSRHLPSLLLRDKDSDPLDTVVRWDRAKQRFANKLQADPVHLEALLILCAQAYEHSNQPLLGLRVHVFGKSEPRTFWTLDEDINKRIIVDEHGLDKLERPATDFISCRKCGHMAWAALAVPSGQAGCQEFTLKRVPTFYEDTRLEGGAEFVVLHSSDDINVDVVNRKDWSVQNCEVRAKGQEVRVNWIQNKIKKKAKSDSNNWSPFVRIMRTSKDEGEARDDWSCPACGATSNEDRRPVLLTPRGSGATDLSVYGAAVMSSLEIPEERRLLFFCDNRQETSFLAGFLSDRHRRFNLRRAIASFFDSARRSGMQDSWQMVCEIDANRQPKGHRFDLAARILLSVKHGKFWGTDSLPREEVITRRDLVDLIPRDVLEVDWLDLKDRDNPVHGYKNWLLDNRSIEGAGQETDLATVQEKVELFHTDMGSWILKTMTEVILIEVSTLFAREGSLQNVGLATWGLKGFEPSLFDVIASRHPEWKLQSQGLFLISHWLLMRLAEQGLWEQLTDSSRRHAAGQRARTQAPDLKDIISKSLDGDKPLSTSSRIGRLIAELAGDEADAALEIWSRSATWLELLKFSPLERFVLITQTGTPKIKSEPLAIHGRARQFRGNNSALIIAVDPTVDLKGMPTGKKNDFWTPITLETHGYYRELYVRSFEEEPRLIRALEHNGMLGSNRASEALQEFSTQSQRGAVNTLVASPTLEMGVDLPDLPVVIHRSVPPDPSNYAQRAGRAGRGPKRAFVITHCGMGSHDLSFYESPEKMVSGEILPPGLPRENAAILKRHVQGLVLGLLAVRREDLGPNFSFKWWGELTDLRTLRERYRTFEPELRGEDREPLDWESVLKQRQAWIHTQTRAFIDRLSQGLWSGLSTDRMERLEREVNQTAHPIEWKKNFSYQLERYLSRAEQYLLDLEETRQRIAKANLKDQSTLLKQQHRAMSLVRLYLTQNEDNYPLSYLGANGFLPNFDFPGRSVRFVGVQNSLSSQTSKSDYKKREDQYLRFSRSADVALREFAPEQIIYGQGFKYKVDRYIADGESDRDGRSYGICKNGCAELSEPDATYCRNCQGELLTSEDGQEKPRLIEIQEVQGYQDSVISDKESKRTFNGMVRDIRRFKINKADTYYKLKDFPFVRWHYHLSPDAQVETVTFLSGSMQKGQVGLGSTYFSPVYKEKVGPETKSFRVLMKPDEEKAQAYETFWPSFFSKGQALVFKLSFEQALKAKWIKSCEDEVDLNLFYRTLSQLLARASTRVLRLNKRKGGLRFIDDKILGSLGDGQYAVKHRHILILDTEEGGSGIIDLVFHYWDAIMDECTRLVEQKCCRRACYQCLKSYDNQQDHDQLDKSLFYFEADEKREVPLFTALRNYRNGQIQITEATADEEQETDSNSPAEALFEQHLRTNYPFVRSTQVGRVDFNGKTVTIADFTIRTLDQEEVDIFVDGYQYHGIVDTMRADCLKRNKVALQARRAIILPAVIAQSANIQGLSDVLNLLNQPNSPMIHLINKTLPDLPFDPEFARLIHKDNTLRTDRWQCIDQDAFKEILVGPWGQTHFPSLQKFLTHLDPEDLPIAFQDGVMLFPVRGHDLCAAENYKRWVAALVMYGISAAMGKRIAYFWILTTQGHSRVS